MGELHVVVVDNRDERDNWITNQTDMPVEVACSQMWGDFTVKLAPGQRKEVTFEIEANAYPEGAIYDRWPSKDELKYHLGDSEEWEVRGDQDGLRMEMVDWQA